MKLAPAERPVDPRVARVGDVGVRTPGRWATTSPTNPGGGRGQECRGGSL